MRCAMFVLAMVAMVAMGQALEKDSEQKIRAKDLPGEVRAGVDEYLKTKAAGATVKGYAKETEEGKTFYEVELRIAGKTRDVTFDTAGKLFGVEQEVGLGSLPAAAQAAVKEAANGGRIALVESVEKGGQQYWEAHIKKGRKEEEVKVDAAGKRIP